MFYKDDQGNFALRKEFTDNMSGKILVNALEHFALYGYMGANIRSITEASGVTKPTLYYYFKNKEHLYREVAKKCFEYVVEGLKKAASNATGTENRLRALSDEMARLCRDGLPAVKFAFGVACSAADGLPDVGSSEYVKQVAEIVDGILKEGIASGEVKAANFDESRYLIVSALTLHARYLMGTGGKTPDENYMATFEKAIHQALN